VHIETRARLATSPILSTLSPHAFQVARQQYRMHRTIGHKKRAARVSAEKTAETGERITKEKRSIGVFFSNSANQRRFVRQPSTMPALE
jgi:hypothetical protein